MSRVTREQLVGTGVVLTIALMAWLDFQWLGTYRYRVDSPDFLVYYLAARVGASHGWAAIYDPSIFLPLERAIVGPPLPYLNPPELAWIVLPLSWLPYAVSAWIWRGLLLAAGAVSCWLVAPRRGKLLHGLSAIVLLPIFASVAFGQVSLVIVAVVAIAWALLQRDRPWLAGAVLSLLILKPQLAFLVPVSLLLAGYGRVFVAWLSATALLAGSALLTAGPGALDDIAQSLRLVYDLPGPVQLSALHLLPTSLAWLAMAAALIVGIAVVLGVGRRQPSMAIAVGLLTSALVSPYLNFYDVSSAVLAGWLLLGLGARPWFRALLMGGYLALYVAPVLPLLTDSALALCLVLLLARWRSEAAEAQSDMQAGALAA